MSNVFIVFLTPQPPQIRFCPISDHAPISWCRILTLRSQTPLMTLYTNSSFLFHLLKKNNFRSIHWIYWNQIHKTYDTPEHAGGNNIKSKDVTFVLKILAKEKNDKEIMIKVISKVFRCKIIKCYLLQGIMQKKPDIETKM